MSLRTPVVPIGAGIAAAVITSFVLRPKEVAPTVVRVDDLPSSTESPRITVDSLPRSGADFDGLAGRVRALEQRAPAAGAEAPAAPDPDVAAKDEQKWAAQLDSHKREARDERWATHASAALSKDLGAVLPGIESKPQLVDVECRTTTCAATIEWPSYADAHASAQRLVMGPFGSENCDRTIHLSDAHADGRYQAVMLFDCEGVRSGRARETLQ